MGFPSTALGIETASSELRVIQLSAADERATVTGYAAVARPIDEQQLGKSVGQLIAALNPDADTPINLVDSAETDERALNDVLARLAELGLNNVDFEPVERARERAIGRNAPDTLTGFIDCPVPKGLLASHERLEIADLAPAVGAALARLGLGFSAERASDEHVAIWVPDERDEPASEAAPGDASAPDDGTTDGEVFAVETSSAAAVAPALHVFDAPDDAHEPDAADEPTITTAADDERPTTSEPASHEPADQAGSNDPADETDLGDITDLGDETDLGDLDGPGTVSTTEPTTAAAAATMAHAATPVSAMAPSEMPAIVAAEPLATTVDGEPHDSLDDEERASAVRPVVMALGLIALVGFGLLAFLFFGGSDDAASPSAPVPTTASETDEVLAADQAGDAATATAPETTPVPEPTAAAEPTATAVPEPTPEPQPEPTPSAPAAEEPAPEEPASEEPAPEQTVAAATATDAAEDLVPLSELPERGAIYRASEGLLYLQGPVSAEEAIALEARAIEVLGPDRVVNEYIIRTDAPPVTEGNVRVEQAVLFETGSAVIADEFLPTLELGVLVLTLNPQVTMTVAGHTDDVGSDEINQALSERRAESVVDYLVSRGIDRERLVPVGFGETNPIGDNTTEAGRQLNRRIEVDLVDLLSPRPEES